MDVTDPVWRPDGEALAFVADEHARDEHSYERADLWTVSLDGQVTRLTDDEYHYSSPDWAPGGTRLVVRGYVGLDVVIRERWDHGAAVDLFAFSVDGSERINLTESWDLIPGAPRWGADGRWIYFTGGIGGRYAPLPGVERRWGGGATHAGRRPGRRRELFEGLSNGGLRVPVSYRARRRLHGNQGRGARRLTDLNGDWLDSRQLTAPERLAFTSPDGTPVEGWMLPPAIPEQGTEHPMVLTIHGGPHGAYGNEFAFDRHLLSRQGLLRALPQPASVHRVRRSLPVGHLGELGRRGL